MKSRVIMRCDQQGMVRRQVRVRSQRQRPAGLKIVHKRCSLDRPCP